MEHKKFYDFLIKVQAIAKIGLLHSKDEYALVNYQEINDLTLKMLENFLEVDFKRPNFFERDIYPTPNVSVRALIFNDEGHLLFVQEAKTKTFSLPGGWVDLYQSPKEALLDEVLDEAGLEVEIERLIGVLDHTPLTSGTPEFVLAFLCKPLQFVKKHSHETLGASYFALDSLPRLSNKLYLKEIMRLVKAVEENKVIYE